MRCLSIALRISCRSQSCASQGSCRFHVTFHTKMAISPMFPRQGKPEVWHSAREEKANLRRSLLCGRTFTRPLRKSGARAALLPAFSAANHVALQLDNEEPGARYVHKSMVTTRDAVVLSIARGILSTPGVLMIDHIGPLQNLCTGGTRSSTHMHIRDISERVACSNYLQAIRWGPNSQTSACARSSVRAALGRLSALSVFL